MTRAKSLLPTQKESFVRYGLDPSTNSSQEISVLPEMRQKVAVAWTANVMAEACSAVTPKAAQVRVQPRSAKCIIIRPRGDPRLSLEMF